MNVKQKLWLVLSIAVGVSIFLIFYKDENHPILKSPTRANSESTKKLWELKSDERGAVAISVTPLELSSTAPEWKFDVTLNTHSVELDWDMVKTATLVDDGGNSYKPQKWDGALGGHHREGVLIFAPIVPTPTSVELKIAGGVEPVKNFAWNITN